MHKISSLDHIAGVCVQNQLVLHDFFCLGGMEAKKIHLFTFFVDKIVMKHVPHMLSP